MLFIRFAQSLFQMATRNPASHVVLRDGRGRWRGGPLRYVLRGGGRSGGDGGGPGLGEGRRSKKLCAYPYLLAPPPPPHMCVGWAHHIGRAGGRASRTRRRGSERRRRWRRQDTYRRGREERKRSIGSGTPLTATARCPCDSENFDLRSSSHNYVG